MPTDSNRNNDAHLARLYGELHEAAARLMQGQPAGHTLQPTALVHEAYLRLAGGPESSWVDHSYFFALAARAMRHVLIDHARGRNRDKRPPRERKVELDGVLVAYEDRAIDIVALDEALSLLEQRNPTMARAVELRFFGGLDVTECAKQLGLSKRTFERNWSTTRTWLFAHMQ